MNKKPIPAQFIKVIFSLIPGTISGEFNKHNRTFKIKKNGQLAKLTTNNHNTNKRESKKVVEITRNKKGDGQFCGDRHLGPIK